MKNKLIIFLFLSGALIFMNFTKESSPGPDAEIHQPTPYELIVPPGFPYMVIPDDNPATVEGIQLGRMLYYDPIIDKENKRACADCHLQETSFSCIDNCLPHVNLAWNNTFLWNGKVRGVLEDVMLFEVEEFFKTDVSIINAHDKYPELFKKAFGTDTITSKEIAYALAQFERTLSSSNSKWDKVIRGETSLTTAESKGRDLYYSEKGDCFHCHGMVLLTDHYFHNNGMDSIPALGRNEITGNHKDIGKFKTPTLRNIELTAPYMHDGRYASLCEVIDFYSEDVKWSPTIDPLMKKAHKGGIHLNEEEKSNLLAFLKTFTDTTFLNNPDFSNPFQDGGYRAHDTRSN